MSRSSRFTFAPTKDVASDRLRLGVAAHGEADSTPSRVEAETNSNDGGRGVDHCINPDSAVEDLLGVAMGEVPGPLAQPRKHFCTTRPSGTAKTNRDYV
jgi:hypothetical protein